MSHFGRISTIYRAEVIVPDDVFEQFGNSTDYGRVSASAANAVESSGQNSYADVIEWGEARTRKQCEDFIAHWHNWILQWQAQLRSRT